MCFSAVILAGGRSSRMGRNKAWLEFRNRPLILHQVETVRRCGATRIFISASQPESYGTLGWPVLEDNFPGLGPLSGVEKALCVLEDSLLLVLAVDMPFVTAAMLRRLSAQCDSSHGAAARFDGRVEPLAAFYPKSAHRSLLEFIGTGFFSARQFVELGFRVGLMRPFDVTPREAVLFANWNTPEDVTDSRKSLSQVKVRSSRAR